MMNHLRVRLLFWCGLLVACCSLLFITFTVKSNSGAEFGYDLRILQAAGVAWSHGLNAYDDRFIQQLQFRSISPDAYDFAYPPHAAWVCLLLAAFPLEIAKLVMTGLNLVCAIGFSLFGGQLLLQPQEHSGTQRFQSRDFWLQGFVPLVVLGNPLTYSVIASGQTTLIVGAALSGSWYFFQQKRWLLSGCLLGVASIKPQLSLLFVVWFLLERRWRLLAAMMVTILGLSIVPLTTAHPVELITTWLANIAEYSKLESNRLGNFLVFGLQNFLDEMGITVPSLFPIALVLTLALWVYRAKILIQDVAPLLLGIVLLFGFSHYYDLAILIPFLAIAFWQHLSDRPIAATIAGLLGLTLLIPRAFIMHFSTHALLLQCRVPAVLIFMIWLLVLSVRRKLQLHAFPDPV